MCTLTETACINILSLKLQVVILNTYRSGWEDLHSPAAQTSPDPLPDKCFNFCMSGERERREREDRTVHFMSQKCNAFYGSETCFVKDIKRLEHNEVDLQSYCVRDDLTSVELRSRLGIDHVMETKMQPARGHPCAGSP